MSPRLKIAAALIPLFFTAFSSPGEGGRGEMSYVSLRFLKKASAPHEMKLIMTDPSTRTGGMERGVLFTYQNRDARRVDIAGDFNSWSPVRMTRSRHGVWYYFLPGIEDGGDVRYKYLADGIWTRDPLNDEMTDDGMGSSLSMAKAAAPMESGRMTYRALSRDLFEFRLYRPRARLISLVGDFNNWNPENDLMAKGPDGVWRLKKRLPKGTHRYKYIIDGDWLPDVYNGNSASDDTGDVCSLITVK